MRLHRRGFEHGRIRQGQWQQQRRGAVMTCVYCVMIYCVMMTMYYHDDFGLLWIMLKLILSLLNVF
jgi:hypothetical protein